ncbi:GFA family protein [Bradyrhizobium sp. CIAT3101]|uniref:GFA family protein n=1 Tax=Bradyrhizobium sp. CIAT3101 TaxID=439387 RepID=UPI0024B06D80|nr:GFA family protein [Bradyrhizobium sp. CIAT3101]WFU84364.1 GFA family protein [Bradyrhizobium sp. CIAT3101]
MIDARCSCGAVSLSLPGPTNRVAACHCIECQRRSGAPFGVGAFYPADTVTIFGTTKEYVRPAESGGTVRSYFCPDCGSTVYWKADNLPAMIGVALGAIADPNFPAPIKSVFERSKHVWVEITGADVEHLPHCSIRKTSS